ncbi:6376_t:CDS:2, partial [Acaulospora morrowiae]
LSEVSPSVYRAGPVSSKFFDALCELQKSRNLDSNIVYRSRSLLEENGRLEDINEEKNVYSYSTEDGKLGKAAVDNAKTVFNNLKPLYLPILAVTPEKFDEMFETCVKEMEDNKIYHDTCRVYGRKKENV